MARYRIDEKDAGVAIELTEVGGKQDELLAALGECQSGHCSCPTDEYQKLASMEIEQLADTIKLQLIPKEGEKFDTSEIAACLDYTTEQTGD